MLNCIAIYRGMDKKPYGNILKEPEIKKLYGAASIKTGGDSVMDILSKSYSQVDKLIHKDAGIAEFTPSALGGIVSDTINSGAVSAFITRPADKGKSCPSAG